MTTGRHGIWASNAHGWHTSMRGMSVVVTCFEKGWQYSIVRADDHLPTVNVTSRFYGNEYEARGAALIAARKVEEIA